MSLLLIATGAAQAESCSATDSEDVQQTCFGAARKCASIRPDTERLACFDKVYADETARTSAPVELTASPDEYADRNADATRSSQIVSTIVAITTNAHNIDFLELENGHTWRENEDSRVRFRTGRKVTIEQGMFGSFNLTMEGAPRPVKVKRVE